ncbi:MAG: hypothetical protein M1588_04095 [Planctomycetes bacterium]|jgi:hypothetical protein|nr:hypothetical protein [Planctomycetota bacterium]
MRSIAAGVFKTHCLALRDVVRTKRQSVVITKGGRPISQADAVGRQAR